MSDTPPDSPPGPKRGRKALARKHALPDFTPVPRLKQRSNGWKPEVQRAFIEALADTGSVRAACRRIGRSEHGAYMMRRHPQGRGFAKAWEAALQLGVRRLEDIAMDRALNGVEVPVYHYGKLAGSRRVYNDRLLMFILRNRAGKRFAAGGDGGSGAGALKIVQQRKMKKLKQLWFEEWEAEQRSRQVSPAEVRASINRKIAEVRRRVEANTSPRGHELRLQMDAQQCADHEAGWRAGQPYEPFAEAAAELFPKHLEALRRDRAERQELDPQPLLEDGRCEPTEDNSEQAVTRAPSADRQNEGQTETLSEEERARRTRSEIAAILWERRKQRHAAARAKREAEEIEEEDGGDSPPPIT